MKDYRTLILEGGGAKCYAYPFALAELSKHGFSLKQITRFAGSSAGAITAALLACGANSSKLMQLINVDFSKFKDDKFGYLRDLYALKKYFGFCEGATFKAWFKDCLQELTDDRDITFGQVKQRFDTELFITATNLTKGRLKIFCPQDTPHFRVADAVRMSMAIPLFYRPVWVGGDCYVDGGVLANFPDLPGNGTKLGLRLVGDSEDLPSKITTLKEFIGTTINTMMLAAEQRYVSKDLWKNTISINTGSIGSTDFKLTNKQKIFLQNSGKKAVKKFCTP